MRSTIHMNLLDHSELKGSNPVRFRVLAPVLSFIVLTVLLVMVADANSKAKLQLKTQADIQEKADRLQGRKKFEEMTARKKAADSSLNQLDAYMGSRLMFGKSLKSLQSVVPKTVQFTSMEITKPVRPVEKKPPAGAARGSQAKAGEPAKSAVTPKVKIAEKVEMLIGGFADSNHSVESLQHSLQSGAFSNLVVKAEIPDRSFRLATGRDGVLNGDMKFVFELKCECRERVFE